jgi:GntR family transcriptional regulator, arabinose operon transcriptional repressor
MNRVKIPLYAQIYTHLIEEIKAGLLQPGDRMPTEKDLAHQFSVSRITSKRALEELVRVNVVQRLRGKGSFVVDILPDLSRINIPAPDSEDTSNEANGVKMPLVCLIMPDFSNAYGLKLLYAIETALSAHRAFLVLKRTYGDRDQEQQAIHRFVRNGGAGLIVMPVHGEFYNEEILRLALEGYPLVTVDRYLKGIATCAVYTDNTKAAYDLTSYLLDRGHEHIAFLSPPREGTSSIEERFEGYSAALAARGLSPRLQTSLTNLFSTLPQSFHGDKILTDEEKIRTFIVRMPQITAFVTVEYNIALILAEVLVSLGKRVPEDYAIVCFDSPDDPFGPPAFTHVEQDETSMGRIAVDLLLAQLRGEAVPARTTVPFQLVEGRSTALAPAAVP